jgi:hypothetical protein
MLLLGQLHLLAGVLAVIGKDLVKEPSNGTAQVERNGGHLASLKDRLNTSKLLAVYP